METHADFKKHIHDLNITATHSLLPDQKTISDGKLAYTKEEVLNGEKITTIEKRLEKVLEYLNQDLASYFAPEANPSKEEQKEILKELKLLRRTVNDQVVKYKSRH